MSKNGHVYTPKETKEYEKLIRDEWTAQNPINSWGYGGPVMVYISFSFKRAKSHYNSKGQLKADAPTHYVSTPDLDNIEKAVLDALNGVAYKDDKQIIIKASSKHYGEMDRILIRMVAD